MIRPPVTHVVLIDGTFASLMQGRHSNIGQIYRLLRPMRGPGMRVHYSAGQQWEAWGSLIDIVMGRGLGERILDAYGWIASAYRPGDFVYLLGYSRGAFAVRSLAGMIERVGLLKPAYATERNLGRIWQIYRDGASRDTHEEIRSQLCHKTVPIAFLGVFDTVMALGIRVPILRGLTEPRFHFHDQRLGGSVRRGVQALALNETRTAFQPILWDSSGHPGGIIKQMWFRGTHADIGGQLFGNEAARPLANIPLVWMLEQAEQAGFPAPEGWREGFPCDAAAPSVGNWRGWGKAFIFREPRIAGIDVSEELHGSVVRPYSGPAVLTGNLTSEVVRMPSSWGSRRRKRRMRRANQNYH